MTVLLGLQTQQRHLVGQERKPSHGHGEAQGRLQAAKAQPPALPRASRAKDLEGLFPRAGLEAPIVDILHWDGNQPKGSAGSTPGCTRGQRLVEGRMVMNPVVGFLERVVVDI